MHIEFDDLPQQNHLPKEYVLTPEETSAAADHIETLLRDVLLSSVIDLFQVVSSAISS